MNSIRKKLADVVANDQAASWVQYGAIGLLILGTVAAVATEIGPTIYHLWAGLLTAL